MSLPFPIRKLFIVMITLTALALTSCAEAAQQFVDLPVEQELALTSIVTALFAIAFDWAIGRFPWLDFFRQYREAWSLAAAALVVKGIENALPTGSDAVSIPAVGLLIAVALYLLGRTLLVRRNVQGFQA